MAVACSRTTRYQQAGTSCEPVCKYRTWMIQPWRCTAREAYRSNGIEPFAIRDDQFALHDPVSDGRVDLERAGPGSLIQVEFRLVMKA